MGHEITNGWNINVEVGIDLFRIVSGSIGGGYERTESTSDTFSVTRRLDVLEGTAGFPTFTPRIVCELSLVCLFYYSTIVTYTTFLGSKGSFQGDCSALVGFGTLLDELQDQALCVPKLIKVDGQVNIPDGRFIMVQID